MGLTHMVKCLKGDAQDSEEGNRWDLIVKDVGQIVISDVSLNYR